VNSEWLNNYSAPALEKSLDILECFAKVIVRSARKKLPKPLVKVSVKFTEW